MNKCLSLLIITLLSAPAFARSPINNIRYSCGQMQYRGSSEVPIGGPRYTVIKSRISGNVYLESRPLNPMAKPSKVQAKVKSGRGEMIRYTTGDMNITFIYNVRDRKTHVSIHSATNYDWYANCKLEQ